MEFKLLILVKFKGDAVVDEIFKRLEKLVFEIDAGKGHRKPGDGRQGFSHAFTMTLNKKGLCCLLQPPEPP
ncbi:hypothetical protein SAY87_013696 [Trapa incisa]|uniref:Uncharacterized protein n=1 Tax=Trapa incisa TaxID=236973 RepID=A0AAN7KGQ0_9MYRT|nr:hypothetical protein SAY87_013696 [Trapa incisa]